MLGVATIMLHFQLYFPKQVARALRSVSRVAGISVFTARTTYALDDALRRFDRLGRRSGSLKTFDSEATDRVGSREAHQIFRMYIAIQLFKHWILLDGW